MSLRLAFAGLLVAVAAHANAVAPKVEHAWIRWLPGDLPAAGYATITNSGDKAIELTGADSADYGQVMLHRSFHKNGESHMQMVPAIAIPAHGHISLAPGGFHLMLMHARRPIKPGDKVKIELHFSDGSSQSVDFPVRPANASGDAG